MNEPARSTQDLAGKSRARWAIGACLGMALAATFGWLYFSAKRPAVPEKDHAAVVLAPIHIEPPPATSVADLQPMLASALGFVEGASPSERLYLLRRLAGPLSEIDSNAALSSLLAMRGAGESPGWHAEYIHEICLMLRRCVSAGEHYARALITLAGDAARPVIIRDYALQHLATLWPDQQVAHMQSAIIAELQNLVLAGPPVSAAALLALHRLGDTDTHDGMHQRNTPGVSDERITALAADVLTSSSDTPTRMAAVRIVADRLLAGQRDALRRIAAAEDEPTVLRMAAAAAIGRYADPRDAVFIDSIHVEEGSLLAGALRLAGERIAASAK
jgi:hypothetical protein